MFYKFLWNKTERVKRVVLTQKYEHGGLKMLNIEMFRKRALCKWVKKITTQITTNPIFISNVILNNIVPELLLLKFNTSFLNITRSISRVLNLPVFYKDLVESWYDCKEIDGSLHSGDVFWLNENITYKGKTLFLEHWVKKGFLYVEDFLHENQLLSRHELTTRLGIRPDFVLNYYLMYNVFRILNWSVNNIPARSCGIQINRFAVEMCNNNTFDCWLKNNEHENACKDKETYWANLLDTVIDWPYTWTLIHRLKLDTKCIVLQWKILQKIYPTKVLLQKMGIKDNNICTSCNEIDSISHFFVTCKAVRALWEYIESSTQTHLNVKDRLLGYEHHNFVKFQNLNKMIIVAKLCISKFKYGDYPNLLILFQRECRYRKVTV